jgi:hypothetical protein
MRTRTGLILALLAFGCGEDTVTSDGDLGMGTEPDASGFETGDTDMVDFTCQDSSWAPAACEAGTVAETTGASGTHTDEPEVIEYDDVPASAGPHRGVWGLWGEYEFMPPQRYIHNLEHGGVALLYNPCAPAEVVDSLREFARARPDDDGGEFRWILTPYPGLPTTVAVAAWESVYSSHCVDTDEITAFVDTEYRTAPEDVPRDGSYDRLWIGR